MNRFVLASLLFAATTFGALAQQVGGAYTVEGTNLGGGSYSGTALIEGITDTTCSIVWETGGQVSEGICMRYGIAFSAFYAMEGADGPQFGLVIYEIKDNGTLEGIWTITGENGAGTEVLTPAN